MLPLSPPFTPAPVAGPSGAGVPKSNVGSARGPLLSRPTSDGLLKSPKSRTPNETRAQASAGRSMRVAFADGLLQVATSTHRRRAGTPYQRAASLSPAMPGDSSDPAKLLVPTPQRPNYMSPLRAPRSILKRSSAPILMVGSAEEGKLKNGPRKLSLSHIDDFKPTASPAALAPSLPPMSTADALAILAKASAQPDGPVQPEDSPDFDVFSESPAAIRAAELVTYQAVRRAYDALFNRLRTPQFASDTAKAIADAATMFFTSIRRDMQAVLSTASATSAPDSDNAPSSDDAPQQNVKGKKPGKNEDDLRRWKLITETAQAAMKAAAIASRSPSSSIFNGACYLCIHLTHTDESMTSLLSLAASMPQNRALTGMADRELITVANWFFANTRPSRGILSRLASSVMAAATASFEMAVKDNEKTRRMSAEALASVCVIAESDPEVFLAHLNSSDFALLRPAMRTVISNTPEVRRRAIAALGAITHALNFGVPPSSDRDALADRISIVAREELARELPYKTAHSFASALGSDVKPPKTNFEALCCQLEFTVRSAKSGHINLHDATWMLSVHAVIPVLLGKDFHKLEGKEGPKAWILQMMTIREASKLSPSIRALADLGIAHFIHAFLQASEHYERAGHAPWILDAKVISLLKQFVEGDNCPTRLAHGKMRGASSRYVLRTLIYVYSHYATRPFAIEAAPDSDRPAPLDIVFDYVVDPQIRSILHWEKIAVSDEAQIEVWSWLAGMLGSSAAHEPWSSSRLLSSAVLSCGSNIRTDPAQIVERALRESVQARDVPTWDARWRLTQCERIFQLLAVALHALERLKDPASAHWQTETAVLPALIDDMWRQYLKDVLAIHLAEPERYAAPFDKLTRFIRSLAGFLMLETSKPIWGLHLLAIARTVFSSQPDPSKPNVIVQKRFSLLDARIARLDLAKVDLDAVIAATVKLESPKHRTGIWQVIATIATEERLKLLTPASLLLLTSMPHLEVARDQTAAVLQWRRCFDIARSVARDEAYEAARVALSRPELPRNSCAEAATQTDIARRLLFGGLLLEQVPTQDFKPTLPLLKLVAADLALKDGLSDEQSRRWLDIAMDLLKRCECPETLLEAVDALQPGLVAQLANEAASTDRLAFLDEVFATVLERLDSTVAAGISLDVDRWLELVISRTRKPSAISVDALERFCRSAALSRTSSTSTGYLALRAAMQGLGVLGRASFDTDTTTTSSGPSVKAAPTSTVQPRVGSQDSTQQTQEDVAGSSQPVGKASPEIEPQPRSTVVDAPSPTQSAPRQRTKTPSPARKRTIEQVATDQTPMQSQLSGRVTNEAAPVKTTSSAPDMPAATSSSSPLRKQSQSQVSAASSQSSARKRLRMSHVEITVRTDLPRPSPATARRRRPALRSTQSEPLSYTSSQTYEADDESSLMMHRRTRLVTEEERIALLFKRVLEGDKNVLSRFSWCSTLSDVRKALGEQS